MYSSTSVCHLDRFRAEWTKNGCLSCTLIQKQQERSDLKNYKPTQLMQNAKKEMMERTKNIDIALVYELWDEYVAATNSGDLERWMSIWSDDGIQLAPGEPLRIGMKQIREAMRATFELYDTCNLTIHMEEVRIIGWWAYSYGTFTFGMTSKDRGESANCGGKFLDILVKQTDGLWKIAIDCHNYEKAQNKNIAGGQENLGKRL